MAIFQITVLLTSYVYHGYDPTVQRFGFHRTAVISSMVTFSTIYLGIHWITDIVLGIALAWAVTWAAMRTDYRILPSR